MALDPKAETALIAIRKSYGTPEGEEGPNEFIEHHLEELDATAWTASLGVPTPTPEQILDGLVLVGSWDSEEDGVIDTFDFGLPNNVTHYMISVRFEGNEVAWITMES